VDEKNNSVVTTKRFHARVPAIGDDPGAGIQALNGAFQQVALAIVSWVSRRTA
jgi:cholesterol transport system auxiliary component